MSYNVNKILKGSVPTNWTDNSLYESLSLAEEYSVHDLFENGNMISKVTPRDELSLRVNPSGVRMVKLVPIS